MGDWLDDAVKNAKDKYSAKRLADEQFVLAQKLRHDFGRQFYQALLGWLSTQAKDFNLKFGSTVVVITTEGNDHNKISAGFTKEHSPWAMVSYHDNTQQIGWSVNPTLTHTIQLELVGDTGVIAVAGTERLTVEQLGEKILSPLLA
jgi:hypothetical protein